MDQIAANRELMKSNFAALDRLSTDQSLGRPQPPLEKPFGHGSEIIALPAADPATLVDRDLFACIKRRRSRRAYTRAPLSLEELAFLLWATQGVQRVFGRNYSTFRTVPSGGARHPFETYRGVFRITGLEPAIYRYLALSHQLLLVRRGTGFAAALTKAALGQSFVAEGAALFIWSCLPCRGEWRYSIAAHKTMLLDAGHLCQNLYLASEAISAGTCAIAAYDQRAFDRFLGLDGTEEFVVYMAPVGKVGS